jgi:hypothetical protein
MTDILSLRDAVLLTAVWLRKVVAGVSPHRHGFNPRPVNVEFVVALGQVFL